MDAADYDEPLAACPICGGGAVRPFDRDYRGHSISACRGCGVKFMNPQYTDRYLERLYAGYTYADHPADRPLEHRRRPEVRLEGKRRSLELLARFVDVGRLLMIGCGDGLELEVARDLGWTVEGFDIDAETAQRASAERGVPVHHGRLDRLGLRDGAFDAVFMDQVIEHPKDPDLYFRGVKQLLRPGGALFIGTPNIGSISNRAKTLVGRLGLRERWRGKHYATQHHLFYYTPRVMRRILEDLHGYDVLTVRGSLKPQKKRLTPMFSRWLPALDSGFLLIARKTVVEAPASRRSRRLGRLAWPLRTNEALPCAAEQGCAPAGRVT